MVWGNPTSPEVGACNPAGQCGSVDFPDPLRPMMATNYHQEAALPINLPGFLLLCLVMTLTPGLDTAMVLRSSLALGRRAGLRTAFGCATGSNDQNLWMGLGEVT